MMNGRGLVNRLAAALLALTLLPATAAHAEDGYALWLRYAPLSGDALARLQGFAPRVERASGTTEGPMLAAAEAELVRGLASLGAPAKGKGAIRLDCPHAGGDGDGSFHIRAIDARTLVIAGADHRACLYGAFALLRELSLGRDPLAIALDERPVMPLRMLDHWDNEDGSVERGYAGRSIFDWWRLPDHFDRRLIDYARANASIGIDAVAVNNVNAPAIFLEPRFIAKLKRIADAWRPYGIRVFLSARFSAPRDIGGLSTADPLDPAVRRWWKAKADEIYAAIPDFGGFLVKANSEGQPGPQDYGRSHVDGANMLAAALGSRGTVIWRAFVYSAEDASDRAKQAYAEFVPLDGRFADNVIVQVKNGPIDFQPREPFHPIFGAMPQTRLMFEGQITKEYLGFATHLAFLAPLWKEALGADTGRGGTVADMVRGGGMAGVANIGSDRNWTGGHFDQANWYAFGRLAWNPALASDAIAGEWAAQTFDRDAGFLDAVTAMMLGSRQAVVDYMTPLGLAHQMGTNHHYGPAPWVCDLPRPEWNPCYYSRADGQGIGFDRTAAGSDALAQYAPSIAQKWRDPKAMDEDYLLWFHHLPWDWRTRSGRSLWAELVHRYDRGVAAVDAMAAVWSAQRDHVDAERFADVAADLKVQQREARWWRDASVAWWQSLNGLPLPEGAAPPAHDLDHYRALACPDAPGI